MKLFVLIIVLIVCSFWSGRLSKRPPIYHADRRKVKMTMTSYDYISEKMVTEDISMPIDSVKNITFYQAQDLDIKVIGLDDK